MIIYDVDGQKKSWEWLREKFGDVRVEERQRPDEPGFVVSTLYASFAQSINVTAPLATPVARWWPDDKLPPLPDLFERIDTGVWGAAQDQISDAEGIINFAMGRGDIYNPGYQTGASSVWCEGNSELVSGLGRTARGGSLSVVFVWAEPQSELDLEILKFRMELGLIKQQTHLLEQALEKIERLAR